MKLTAKDVMEGTVYTVREDATLDELAAFLVEHAVSGAPVVGGNGKLVGFVTATDLVEDRCEVGEAANERGGGWRDRMSGDEWNALRVKPEGRLVRDLMTPTLYTVPEDLTIAELARTMVAGRVHRVLVTKGGEIVGIVSALDLLKVLYEEPVETHALVPTA